MFLFNKKRATKEIVDRLNAIQLRAQKECTISKDIGAYNELKRFKESIAFYNINVTSYEELIQLMNEVERADRISGAELKNFVKRAKVAATLTKGETMPEPSVTDKYEEKLDFIEKTLRERQNVLKALNIQADKAIDNDDELTWTRLNSEISVVNSDIVRLNNLFTAIVNKKINISEINNNKNMTQQYKDLVESNDSYVDVDEYEADLDDQMGIFDEVKAETNRIGTINQRLTKNQNNNFAEAKMQRKAKVQKEIDEIAQLEKELAVEVNNDDDDKDK